MTLETVYKRIVDSGYYVASSGVERSCHPSSDRLLVNLDNNEVIGSFCQECQWEWAVHAAELRSVSPWRRKRDQLRRSS